MNTIDNTPTTPPPDEGAADVPKLRRSRDNRRLTGVAGGLAEYFGLSATVYRVLFVALTLAGGTGIVLYAAAALVMPSEGSDESVLTDVLRRNRNRPWLVILLALLGLVVAATISSPPGDFGEFIAWILVLSLITLVVWAARGGRRWIAATIAVFLVLVAGAVATGVTVARAHGGIGEVVERPRVADALQPRYEVGAGHVRLDLRDLQLPAGETRLEVVVGLGEIDLSVPSDVAISGTANARWGEVSVLGRESEGRHVVERFRDPAFAAAERRLVIDARVRLGHVRIRR